MTNNANRYLSIASTIAPIRMSAVNARGSATGFVVVQTLIELMQTSSRMPALRRPSCYPAAHDKSLYSFSAHVRIIGYGSAAPRNLF